MSIKINDSDRSWIARQSKNRFIYGRVTIVDEGGGLPPIPPPPPGTYRITWYNYDNTVLYRDNVPEGELPEYKGPIPTKPSSGGMDYTFDDWNPEVVVATENADYIATYREVPAPPPGTYRITWYNYDGEKLSEDNVPEGTMPVYSGLIPTKPSDAGHIYIFNGRVNGWNPQMVEATKNAKYTATFTEITKISLSPTDSEIESMEDMTVLDNPGLSLLKSDEIFNTVIEDIEGYLTGNTYAHSNEHILFEFIEDLVAYRVVPIMEDEDILFEHSDIDPLVTNSIFGEVSEDIYLFDHTAEGYHSETNTYIEGADDFGFSNNADINTYPNMIMDEVYDNATIFKSSTELTVSTIEIIPAGEYVLTPPASTYLSDMIYFDLPFSFVEKSTGVTYDCIGLYLGDNLVGGDIGSFLPASLATKSSGEAWQTITDSITVTEDTPVTVAQYAAFAEFFTALTIPAGVYRLRASAPAPEAGRNVRIDVNILYIDALEEMEALEFIGDEVGGVLDGGSVDMIAVYDSEIGGYGPYWTGDVGIIRVQADTAVTAEQYAVFFEVFELVT